MVQYIGFFAGALTSISLSPQVIKVYKTRSTHDVSLAWTSLLTFGIYLWLVYGFMLNDIPLILANASGAILSSAIMIGKLMYK